MIAFVLFLFGVGNASAEELRMNLNEQRRLLFAPLATLTRSSLKYEGVRSTDLIERAAGIELGLRIYSISLASQTFFVGFDIRQRLAERALYETKVGIHLDYRMNPFFSLQGGWNFGDTIVTQAHDLQFTGTSATVGISRAFSHVRIFAEYSWGAFDEGPGFIYRIRLAGPQHLNSQTVAIGVEFPLTPTLAARDPGATDARVRPTLQFNPYSGTP